MSKNCDIELKARLQKFYGKDELEYKVNDLKGQVAGIFDQAKKEGVDPLKYLENRINENTRQIEMDAFRRMEQVKKFKAAAEQIRQFGENKEEGFKSLLFTRHGEKYKAGGSLEQFVGSEKNRRISILKRELRGNEHIMQRLKDGDEILELEVHRLEYGELTQDQMGQISKDAIVLHRAIKKLTDYDYRTKKQLGADVAYKKKRLYRQFHDPKNMRDLGQNNWVSLARNSFKEEGIIKHINSIEELTKKYEKSVDPVEDFLKDQYEKIINNEGRKGMYIEDTFQSLQFLGQQKSWEKGSLFEFKNAEAQVAYNRNLNGTSLFENLSRDIIRDSGSTASMKLLGPNPNLTINKLIQDFGLDNGDKLKREFRFAAGRKAGVATGMLPRAAEKARKITDMALLSTSLMSTLPDLSVAAYVISSKTGKNYFSTLGNILVENAKLLPKAKRELYSQRLGILMDDELFDYYRIGEDGKLTNTLDPMKSAILEDAPIRRGIETIGRKAGEGVDKAHNWVMRKTGLPAQSQMMRLAAVKNYAMYLSDLKDSSYDSLFKGTKDLFDRMGISERDWDILRENFMIEGEDGARILDADSILDMSKEKIKYVNDMDFERYKFDLHSKVSGMYDFLANTASPTPGVRSKSWVETIDPNSVAGVLARTVAQYKSFSVSVYNSLREGYGPRWDKDRNLATAYMMVSSMGLAYLGLAGKEAVKGKEVPEIPWEDPREFAKMSGMLLARSGTAGIMFDFLSTDYNSPFRSLSSDIMGPSVRVAESAIGIAKTPLDLLMSKNTKETKKAKRNFLKNVERVSPSIPFTRSVLNENIFDILHKSMNTGAKR